MTTNSLETIVNFSTKVIALALGTLAIMPSNGKAQTLVQGVSQLISSSDFRGISVDSNYFRSTSSRFTSVMNKNIIDTGEVYFDWNASNKNNVIAVRDTGRRSDTQTFELRNDGTVILANNAPSPSSVYEQVGLPFTIGTQYTAVGSSFTIGGNEYVPFLNAPQKKVELFVFNGSTFTNSGLATTLQGFTNTPDGLGNYFTNSVSLSNLKLAVGDGNQTKFVNFTDGNTVASALMTDGTSYIFPKTVLDVDFSDQVNPTSFYNALGGGAFRSLMSAVQFSPSPTSYSTWKYTNFTPTELANSAISGPTAIIGPDNSPNLLKYAFYVPARSAIPQSAQQLSLSENNLALTYTRASDRPDLTYKVEKSEDLSTWTDVGVTQQQMSSNATAGTEMWQGYAPLDAPRKFLRLSVTKQ